MICSFSLRAHFNFSPLMLRPSLSNQLWALQKREEDDVMLSRTLLSWRKIMPSHQFYLGLAVAPVVCFQEPLHFYLPACRGAGGGQTSRLGASCIFSHGCLRWSISFAVCVCIQYLCCDYTLRLWSRSRSFPFSCWNKCSLEYCYEN